MRKLCVAGLYSAK